METKKKPMLNLGCGRVILPGNKPSHHMLVDDAVYDYPEWVNVDKNPTPGVDKCMDLFCYPWDLEDNAYSGALISHVCEHIPHEIRVKQTMVNKEPNAIYSKFEYVDYSYLAQMQDGWFAFFSELWRVLEDGAMVHIIAPYGKSDDAISDPTHTRMLNEFHFRHSMQPNPDAPFEYNHKLHFNVLPDDHYRLTPFYAKPPYLVDGKTTEAFEWAKVTQWNVIQDFYVRMVAIKS